VSLRWNSAYFPSEQNLLDLLHCSTLKILFLQRLFLRVTSVLKSTDQWNRLTMSDKLQDSDKLQEFKNRQKEWRDISVTQLSNTNNILLTLSSGLLAFCIEKEKAFKFRIDLCKEIDWLATTYWVFIFLLGLSITYGIGVLLSRLYDFKISRHIALTRQRFYEKHELGLSYEDLEDSSCNDRMCVLIQILFCKLPFITRKEIENIVDQEKVKDKFKRLRTMANILGKASWRWTKIQVSLFLISGLIYLIHRLL